MEVGYKSLTELDSTSEKILAVGNWSPDTAKAEWFDVSGNVWEELPDYPYGMSFEL